MAQVLNSVLGIFVNPKKVIAIDESKLENLDGKTAHILFAVGEAVLGENFLAKAPNFIAVIDDYLTFQRRSQREAFAQALLVAESPGFNLLVAGKFRAFSHMSVKDRQAVLEKIRNSRKQLHRNIYAAFVNVSASTYYSSPLAWPDIQYKGVSVDHPEILDVPPPPVPWRPDDPRPVER